jgi:hypothetical protein
LPANVCTPYHATGDVSFRAGAAITGKRFVAPSANRTGGPALSTNLENVYVMSHAAANGAIAGVAKYDVAQDKRGSVYGTPGAIVPVTADGVIAAGEEIIVGTDGKAKKWTAPSLSGNAETLSLPVKVGIAMTGAADGADAQIKLY